jgi:hypothetical protein
MFPVYTLPDLAARDYAKADVSPTDHPGDPASPASLTIRICQRNGILFDMWLQDFAPGEDARANSSERAAGMPE